ncbi:hypothetical protein [Sulfitobacter sp. R18_1]|uniref:hypothetical protein n=1 Tax=Sulfitobacter sp. R18_1 TaxID=2821104 RepID=UPI001ADC3332|nr:hypothetical protein [Sulfitobacter sp. R18_1]MBO9427926.1 hypothetical protein [Sulfitobacter sp. R18_1]
MSETVSSKSSAIGPCTRQAVQMQTLHNLMIGVASMSADLIPGEVMKEWTERIHKLQDEAAATYSHPSAETNVTSTLSKPIEWRKGWMSELPNWKHEHWGGLTSFGTYIVQKSWHDRYLATALSGSFIVGSSIETPEEAFQLCQDDLDSRIKEMLL